MNRYLVEVYTNDFAPVADHVLNAPSMEAADRLAADWMDRNGYPLTRFQYVIEQTTGILETFSWPADAPRTPLSWAVKICKSIV